jgi:hypothetical protein
VARPAICQQLRRQIRLSEHEPLDRSGGVEFRGVIENYHDGKELAEITVEQINVNRRLKVADLVQKSADLNPVWCR